MKDIITVNECKSAIVKPCAKYAKTLSQMKYLSQTVAILSSGNDVHICQCPDKEIVSFSSDELDLDIHSTKYRKLTFEDMGPQVDSALATLYTYANQKMLCYTFLYAPGNEYINGLSKSALAHCRILTTYRDGNRFNYTLLLLEGKHKGDNLKYSLPAQAKNTGLGLYRENRFKNKPLMIWVDKKDCSIYGKIED